LTTTGNANSRYIFKFVVVSWEEQHLKNVEMSYDTVLSYAHVNTKRVVATSSRIVFTMLQNNWNCIPLRYLDRRLEL
jgi:hypothetical protein